MASSPNAMKLKILAIVGSVREGRMSERVVSHLKKVFADHQSDGHTFEVIDPEDYDIPLLKQPLHFYRDPSKAPAILHQLNDTIKNADAYIIVSAEYNRTIPPALTNIMDHFPPASYGFKPSAVVTYSMGGQGGVAAAMALKPFLTEFGCLPVKHMVNIPQVHKELKEDGSTENEHIQSSFLKSYKELTWHAKAMKYMRETAGLPT
eukprot:gene8798-9739_t